MIRVLVADDSHATRLLLVELLSSDPELEVCGEVSDGAAAVATARRLKPDVITMDIHMPVLDGLEATARIMNEIPTPIVVVSSSVSSADVQSSFDAMKAGALVALPKPGMGKDAESEFDRQTFISTVKAMARVKVVRRWSGAFRAVPEAPGAPLIRTELATDRRVSIVAIAASTGGPTALQRVLSSLPGDFGAPVLVVQHIAKGFLPGFASWLDGECDLTVRVARDGEPLQGGTVYIAPDDRHLGVHASRRVKLIDSEPVGGFKPSGSVLFESVSVGYGSQTVAVILTGMGSDGVLGLRQVRAREGYVIAQDESSSLIYGMPGEAVLADVVDVSLPIEQISTALRKLTAGPAHVNW